MPHCKTDVLNTNYVTWCLHEKLNSGMSWILPWELFSFHVTKSTHPSCDCFVLDRCSLKMAKWDQLGLLKKLLKSKRSRMGAVQPAKPEAPLTSYLTTLQTLDTQSCKWTIADLAGGISPVAQTFLFAMLLEWKPVLPHRNCFDCMWAFGRWAGVILMFSNELLAE